MKNREHTKRYNPPSPLPPQDMNALQHVFCHCFLDHINVGKNFSNNCENVGCRWVALPSSSLNPKVSPRLPLKLIATETFPKSCLIQLMRCSQLLIICMMWKKRSMRLLIVVRFSKIELQENYVLLGSLSPMECCLLGQHNIV